MIDRTTKIADMSLGQLLDCIGEFIAQERAVTKAATKDSEKIRGVKGLSEYLQCSYRTAQRLIDSGKLDGSYVKSGRVITFSRTKLDWRLQHSRIC